MLDVSGLTTRMQAQNQKPPASPVPGLRVRLKLYLCASHPSE